MSRETPTDFVDARPLDEVGRVALAAAAYMNAHGHCKDILWDAEGRVCFLGAIYKVGGYQHQRAIARRAGFADEGRAVGWNNDPERTAAEVIAALEQAAFTHPARPWSS